MRIIKRKIEEQIEFNLGKGRIIIIYGPRRSGKTTLAQKLISKHMGQYINCEEPFIQDKFANASSSAVLKQMIGTNKLVVFDEAQTIADIGVKLKLLIDSYPDLNIIATGSSSFELANSTVEPLTGRKYEYILYPLSIEEIADEYGKLEVEANIDLYLQYGMYPGVFQKKFTNAELDLKELASSYLFKDILLYKEIKSADVLRKLLQAIALQIGQLVSYNELANLIGIDKNTVIRYIDLLEKSFIIFRLNPFSRNLRNELSKNRKIYFYDLGIRNALINQFNSIELRSDKGGLWENFCVLERKKYIESNGIMYNQYFWRTYEQNEIDLIEEKDGEFNAFEFKFSHKSVHLPKEWLANYHTRRSEVISRKDFWGLIQS